MRGKPDLLEDSYVIKKTLDANWRFRELGAQDWRSANVPGSNFQDLMSDGSIPDPFFRDNESVVQWVSGRDWEYSCDFSCSQKLLEKDRIDLVFHGLDTIADIYLNEAHLAGTMNMFVGFRFDARNFIKPGRNQLRIVFQSPLTYAMPLEQKNGFRYPAENDHSEFKLSVFVRKAPYHFGWDWGPRLVCSGIWRPVEIEAYNTARIEDVTFQQPDISANEAKFRFNVHISSESDVKAVLNVSSKDSALIVEPVQIKIKPGQSLHSFDVSIPDPKLWWPNGHGDQPLYTFKFDLSVDEKVVASHSLRTGIREIHVENEPDDNGESFVIHVNGKAIFAKGANYIPSDSFLTRVSVDDHRETFRSAKMANMNMLRVWGGGVYESDDFYDLADEYGILIWQDFMFACTLYPADQNFIKNVEDEVRYNVRRLRHHPSIALWCGNNEIALGLQAWDWQKKFHYSDALFKDLIDDYEYLFSKCIPSWLDDEMEDRFYMPSSPIGNWEIESEDGKGDAHYWGVWHGALPFSEYERRVFRFASEFGFQSFPSSRSIEKFTLPEDRDINSDVLKQHQKHPRGNNLIKKYMESEFRLPENDDDIFYYSQLLQAYGLKKAFVAHRIARPFCMGTLFWQFNDCWPAASWSCIDYFNRKKALYFEAKRCFKPVAVFARLEDDKIKVYTVNDRFDDTSASLSISLENFQGAVLWQRNLPVTLKAESSDLVFDTKLADISNGQNLTDLFIRVSLTENDREVSCDYLFLAKIADLAFDFQEISYEWHKDETGHLVIDLSSEGLAYGLLVEVRSENKYVELDDNFLILTARHKRKIRSVAPVEGDIEQAAISFKSLYFSHPKT